MRLIDIESMVFMWNDTISKHQENDPDCKPVFEIATEKKQGLAWSYTLKCRICNYFSEPYKLFKEVKSPKPGKNPAAVNLALQVGLQDTPMGNTRARLLFTSMDVPAPARSGMHRTACTVGDKIKELNTDDMKKKVSLVKDIQTLQGKNKDEFDVAMDGRYNSVTISSAKKPGQNASQAIGIACETMTEKKYIVSATFKNKLCWKGAWLKGRGFDISCPGGHPDCTADTNPNAPWSEKKMGQDIGLDLATQGVKINHVTTDGDSSAAKGVEEGIKSIFPLWKVTRLADPVHLGRLQFKKCNNAEFSKDMFPGKTREAKKKMQKIFSQDIKARCSLIFNELMNSYSGDIDKIKAALPKVLEATCRCYAGDCSMCRRHSMVCSGGKLKSWWERSMFLAIHKLYSVNMTPEDKKLLRELIRMRLSEDALMKMRFNTNTQKCEAVNRSFSVSLPKNVNYSRNFAGRASSTIHRINNPLDVSVRGKLSAVRVGVLSPKTEESLVSLQKEREYSTRYRKRPAVKKKLLKNTGRKIQEHLNYTSGNKDQETDYKKGKLDDIQVEHSYPSKRK